MKVLILGIIIALGVIWMVEGELYTNDLQSDMEADIRGAHEQAGD